MITPLAILDAEHMHSLASFLKKYQHYRTVSSDRLTCVYHDDAPKPHASALDSETLRNIQQFQRALEDLQGKAALLPCQFGVSVDDPDAMEVVLRRHENAFCERLVRFGAAREWELRFIRVAGGENHSTGFHRQADEDRISFTDRILTRVDTVIQDRRMLPLTGEGHLLQCIVLLPGADDTALMHVLEEIDASAIFDLTIKLIGPLPACHFCSVSFERVDQAAIQGAHNILHTASEPSTEDIRKAFKERVKTLHPDSSLQDIASQGNELSALTAARALLLRAYEAGPMPEGNEPLWVPLFSDSGQEMRHAA